MFMRRAMSFPLPALLGVVLIGFGLCSFPANARVFNFKDSNLAPYLRVTGALSSLHKSAFENSSSVNTSIDGSSRFAYSGELGFMFGLSSDMNFRLGAELIQHRPVTEASGLSPSGAERFKLDSSVSVFNPNATLEMVFKPGPTMRYFLSAGVGLASVTVENKYTMTTQGTSDYGGSLTDFTEKMEASAIESHVGLGLETVFTDNVTCALDLGYRYLPVRSLKYKGDVKNLYNPSGVSKGDEVLNADGQKRTLDLSGLTLGISFRFYLNFI